MSLSVNGSFRYGTLVDEFPSANVNVYTVQFAIRVAFTAETFGRIAALTTGRAGGGTQVETNYVYNFYERENLRCNDGDTDIPITGPGAVPTAGSGTWAWLVYRCTGSVDMAGPDWSGTVELGYVADGDSTYRFLADIALPDVRLADEYFFELSLGYFGVTALQCQLESVRMWDRALSDAELVAQSRTSANLYTGDQIHYAPFLNVATLAPPDTNQAFWDGTPADGATRPSYPDDGPIVQDLGATDGSSSFTDSASSAALGQKHALGASVAGESATSGDPGALGQSHALAAAVAGESATSPAPGVALNPPPVEHSMAPSSRTVWAQTQHRRIVVETQRRSISA